jgi:hypothetical protein
MAWIGAILWILLAVGVWAALLAHNRRGVRRHEQTGDASRGVIIFVEPVRWCFIIWGFVQFCQGLRRAGRQERILLFRWSNRTGSLLVIPDLARERRLQKKARRLARFIEETSAQHPGSPIHLVGYSSGCYLVLESVLHCSRDVPLGTAILLQGSVSPTYDLRPALERVSQIHSFHSRIDLVNAIGPTLFGSNDRRWGPACGAVGFRTNLPRLTQYGWAPADMRWCYFGDHFTVAAARFVAHRIAPLFG